MCMMNKYMLKIKCKGNGLQWHLHTTWFSTTAATCFPECLKHSGKSQKHSGKKHSGKSLRGCLSRERGLPRVPKIVHSGKPSPSAILPLGDDLTPSAPSPFFLLFPECNTRGRNFLFFSKPLPRVPMPRHSGKPPLFF
jgi:hypothetical protein